MIDSPNQGEKIHVHKYKGEQGRARALCKRLEAERNTYDERGCSNLTAIRVVNRADIGTPRPHVTDGRGNVGDVGDSYGF